MASSSYSVLHAGHRPLASSLDANSINWCQHHAQIWYPQRHGRNLRSVASISLQHSGQSRGVSGGAAASDRRSKPDRHRGRSRARASSARRRVRIESRIRAERGVDRCPGIASSRRRDDRGGAPMRRAAVCVISYTRRPRASLAPRQLVRAERIAGELEVAARLRLRARGGRDAGRATRDATSERERRETTAKRTNGRGRGADK